MFLTALLTAFLLLIGNVLLLVWSFRWFSKKLAVYFSPQGDNPSAFASVVDVIAQTFAQRISQSLKASFLGMQSVDARNIDRLESDLIQDVATATNPILGGLLAQFPSVARRLKKNPELLPIMQGLIAKLPGAVHPGNGHDKSAVLDFGKYKSGG